MEKSQKKSKIRTKTSKPAALPIRIEDNQPSTNYSIKIRIGIHTNPKKTNSTVNQTNTDKQEN